MTIPFDLEAFKNGAVALFKGEERYAHKIPNGRIIAVDIRGDSRQENLEFMTNGYKMKEPVIEESAWIKHDGGPCPIPWAKAGEYTAVRADGQTYGKSLDANELCAWETMNLAKDVQIIAYRLTDRWIPVIDGVCPIDAQRGTFEVKRSNGLVKYIDCNIYKTTVFYKGPEAHVVAVRLIERMPKELSEGLKEARKKSVDLARQLIENQKPKVTQESPQQRLTREASTRYFEKHFLTVEPVKSLGEDEMSRIAGLALEQHDKVWPRKLECSECCGEGWVVQYSKNGIHRFEECSDCRNPHHCGRPG